MIRLDQGGRTEEDEPFRPAEEESFQSGVETNPFLPGASGRRAGAAAGATNGVARP